MCLHYPSSRSALASATVIALVAVLTGCAPGIEESPAYQAACHGPPLESLEQRNQAIEDGYLINRQYDCIDKASFLAVQRQRAEWQAANTPEAIAQREAEFAAQLERSKAQYQRGMAERSREAAAERRLAAAPLPIIELREVDVNTASETEIAKVITLDAEVAAQIVAARNQRKFSGWADLVDRVVGLSTAQPAVYASTCGLTVNGQSLEGAPPNPTIAAILQRRLELDRLQ